MPYCPKCDMEFVDGITTCTDCGSPLLESKEAAMAIKREAEEKARARLQAEREAIAAEYQARSADGEECPAPVRTQVYVKKAQQYDDLKSSASAFLLVGGGLTVFAFLSWVNLIPFPLAGTSGIITKTVLTLMGLLTLYIAYTSNKSAREVKEQVGAEEQVTGELIDWFTAAYTGDGLDEQIRRESGELSPEELSLKRFELIQDLIITNHDIADQSYVDALSEEIYTKLYEDVTVQ